MLFKGRNDAIKFVDNYGSMNLEAKRKAAEPEIEPETESETESDPEPSKEKT